MKNLVQNNFNIVMIIGFLSGLFIPGLEKLPEHAIMITLSAIIFFSCSKTSWEEINAINKKTALLFYALRFIIFPLLAYYSAHILVPDYAIGVLLVSLMPVAVSSTAVTNICKGNASLSLSATIITNAIAPFMIPAIIFLAIGTSIEMNMTNMFTALCLTVFLPSFLYFFIARKKPKIEAWIKNEAQFYSVLLTGLIVALAIGLQRNMFFENPTSALFATLIGCILFIGFYLFGWIFAAKLPTKEQTTYAICSGANNTALSIGIAALYFSPLTLLFCVLTEIPWIIGVALFEKFCRHKQI